MCVELSARISDPVSSTTHDNNMKFLVVIFALVCAASAGNVREKRGFLQGVGSSYYSAPAVSYSAPAVSYVAPAVSYSAPVVSYSAPAISYSAPVVSYSAPAIRYVKKVVQVQREVDEPRVVYVRKLVSEPRVITVNKLVPAQSGSSLYSAASYGAGYASGW